MAEKESKITGEVVNSLDINLLNNVISTLKGNPKLGESLTKAKTVWRGGFRVETDLKDFKIISDEPCALGGLDKAPNPMAILLGAFGSCLGISYVLIASMRGIELEKLEIEIEGDVDMPLFLALDKPDGADAVPGFSEIRSKVFVRGKASMEELQKIHELAAKLSPVGQTCSRSVNVTYDFSKRRLA